MLKCGVCGSWHKSKNALGVHRSTKHRARALVKVEANGHPTLRDLLTKRRDNLQSEVDAIGDLLNMMPL